MDDRLTDLVRRIETTAAYRPVAEVLARGHRRRARQTAGLASGAAAVVALAAGTAVWAAPGNGGHRTVAASPTATSGATPTSGPAPTTGPSTAPGSTGDAATTPASPSLDLAVDTRSDVMAVYDDGKLIKSLRISAGKAGYETPHGDFVVQNTAPSATLPATPSIDASGNYYDTSVAWVITLSPTGTKIYAQPWNASIGSANTTHGDIGLSAQDAQWLYSRIHAGDQVHIS